MIVNVFNNEPGNFSGTLGTPGNWIPVVSISKEDGDKLKAVGIRTVTLFNTPIDDPLFYDTLSGTSMAAPHVSGIAGLILAKNPEFNYTKVKSAILDSVDKIPSVSDMMVSGGRVNALSALCKGVSSLPGDLTCDSNLGLDDAILALQVVSGLNPEICSDCIPIIKDVNGDRRIGMEEALHVMQELGGVGR